MRIEGVWVEDGVGQELRLVQRLESWSLSAPGVFQFNMPVLRTLVTVDEGILDYHRPAISSCELLCLSSSLSEAASVLDLVVWAHSARHAQDMACEEVLGAAEVNVERVRFLVARVEEGFGGGDEEDLDGVLLAEALSGELQGRKGGIRGAGLASTGWGVRSGRKPVRRDSGREAFNRH